MISTSNNLLHEVSPSGSFQMSTLPLTHLHLESPPLPPPPPPPPYRQSTDSGGTASSRSSSADVRSWHSPTDSTGERGSILSGTEIVGVSNKRRKSSVSQCSIEMDLEAGVHDGKAHLSKLERDCRICHLSFDATNQESGILIELGCSCKADLAAAHKQCAETWFKIKGNKTCEICGSLASNVAGADEAELVEQLNEENDAARGRTTTSERRNFWQGHRFLNFLLACMVFAFVISWLFHFNVPS